MFQAHGQIPIQLINSDGGGGGFVNFKLITSCASGGGGAVRVQLNSLST